MNGLAEAADGFERPIKPVVSQCFKMQEANEKPMKMVEAAETIRTSLTWLTPKSS